MGEKFCTVLTTDSQARSKLAKASDKIARAVGVTLGPNGWNAALDRGQLRMPTVTKDGVTVLHDLDFSDKVESMMYELYRDVSDQISKAVGDGTTSVIVLANAIIKNSIKYLDQAGVNPYEFVEGLKSGAKAILDFIEANMKIDGDTEEAIRAVLNVSSAGDPGITHMLTEVFMDIGDDGMIIVKDSSRAEDQVFFEDGYVISMPNDNHELFEIGGRPINILTWNRPYVLVVNDNLINAQQLVPILEQIARDGETKQVVILYTKAADDVKGMFRANNLAKDSPLQILSVRMPMYAERQKDLQEDFAAFADATCADKLDKKIPVESLSLKDLGMIDQVDATKYEIRAVGGRGAKSNRLAERIEIVKKDRDYYTGNVQERIRANERLAKLQSSMCCVYPGAKTEAEAKHRKAVLEDCIRAVQSAVSSGVVPGGGWAYYRASDMVGCIGHNETYSLGFRTVLESAKAIFNKLCKDIEQHPREVLETIGGYKDTEHKAFNFQTMKAGHMLEVGVMDPFQLTKEVLTQAVSAAGTVLLCNGLLTRRPTKYYVPWKDKMQKMEHLRY